MNMVQIYIMWAGILAILILAYERTKGRLVYFWEYTLVVALITAGLMLTVELIKRNKSKGAQENKPKPEE